MVLGAATVASISPSAAAGPPTGIAPERRTCSTRAAPTYTVQSGDTWFDIAGSAQVGVTSLVSANAANASSPIHPGDVLCLPSGAAVSGGSTSPGAASSSGTRSTGASTTSGSCTPTNAPTYTVREGDGWYLIATKAGVSMTALLAANRATADSSLHPGREVCLPAGASPKIIEASAGTTGSFLPANAGGLDALPVQGPCWYGDTWHAGRGAGRVHEGVDVLTAPGNYVYAVVDGILWKRAWYQPGLRAGNAWWLLAADGSGTYYFYAHLAAFAPGLAVGSRVEAGEVIGFVGDTGSAAAPHLHFEIHPRGGSPVNPYPVVRSVGGCKKGAGYPQPSGWTPGIDEQPTA